MDGSRTARTLYRLTVVSHLPRLTFLDTETVSPRERAWVMRWGRAPTIDAVRVMETAEQAKGGSWSEPERRRETTSLYRNQSRDKWAESLIDGNLDAMQRQRDFLMQHQNESGKDEAPATKRNLLRVTTTTGWDESDVEEMERDLEQQLEIERSRVMGSVE